MQFYIKTIRSESDCFTCENNGDNYEIIINICGTNESEEETPKHLIITGINGTGKSSLLESINNELRKKYISLTGNDIHLLSKERVSTQLTYNMNEPESKYFEPFYVAVDYMFKPSQGLNYNDYCELFVEVSRSSTYIYNEFEQGLRELFDKNFESVDIESGTIKLQNRQPFEIGNMSSGHYSFLNIYCCILFCRFALKWEVRDLWECLYNKLSECMEITERLTQTISDYKERYTGVHSRNLDTACKRESSRTKNIIAALGIAESRYETITKMSEPQRSRLRDKELLQFLCRSVYASEDISYKEILNISDLVIRNDFELLNKKLRDCLDKLLGGELEESNNPLIVLIDEPEMHLHVALQKTILPYLTKCFPNAQFIVATHSPFVITSLPNATLFNIENREIQNNDLTLYSYQNVVEGWFGIYLCSDETKKKYNEFKKLADRSEKLVGQDKEDYFNLYSYLIKTDLIGSVTKLNLRKELKDDEIYV